MSGGRSARRRARAQARAATSGESPAVNLAQPTTSSSPKRREYGEWTRDELQAFKDAMELAEPLAINDAFARARANFVNSEWLETQHRVGRNPRNMSKSAPHEPALADAIAEYAAVSAPLHLADSWTYFGRALNALAAGAIDVAEHLLYYCELRAMHSLMHRHGVVLLNKTNSAFSRSGSTPIPFPEGSKHIAANSHQSMWIMFQSWVDTAAGAAFFGDLIRLNGVALSTWAAERPTPRALEGTMSPLVKDWGMDVAHFAKDRALRNQSSYQPTRIKPAVTGVTPAFVADLFAQVWSLLEPQEDEPFQNLDRFIARLAFDSFAASDPVVAAVSATRDEEAEDETSETRSTYADDVDDESLPRAMYRPDDSKSSTEYWAERVLGEGAGGFVVEFIDHAEAYPTPTILDAAGSIVDGGTEAERFEGMVGRALILLRFATGATRSLVEEANCSVGDIEFWLTDMLTLHGIRIPDDNNYLDLWWDVEDSVGDVQELLGNADPVDIVVLRERLAVQFATLSSFERVPAWAVAGPVDPDQAVA